LKPSPQRENNRKFIEKLGDDPQSSWKCDIRYQIVDMAEIVRKVSVCSQEKALQPTDKGKKLTVEDLIKGQKQGFLDKFLNSAQEYYLQYILKKNSVYKMKKKISFSSKTFSKLLSENKLIILEIQYEFQWN
jgi:hypothetical protein